MKQLLDPAAEIPVDFVERFADFRIDGEPDAAAVFRIELPVDDAGPDQFVHCRGSGRSRKPGVVHHILQRTGLVVHDHDQLIELTRAELPERIIRLALLPVINHALPPQFFDQRVHGEEWFEIHIISII